MISRTAVSLIMLAILAVGGRRYSVRGVVTDAAGARLSDADVTVLVGDRIVQVGRSGEDGAFRLEGITDSIVTIRARHVGFGVATETLRFSSTDTALRVRIVLQPIAQLGATRVTATKVMAGDKLHEFYERARDNKFGRYFDKEQIAKSGRTAVSEFLRGLPGITIVDSGVRMRGCRPNVYVDGVHVPNAEIDDVADIEDIAGLEEYSSWAGLPPQFQERENPCGALVVWTKDGAE